MKPNEVWPFIFISSSTPVCDSIRTRFQTVRVLQRVFSVARVFRQIVGIDRKFRGLLMNRK